MRKMKDSGLQWIGNIPEEWTVGRVKDVISLLTDYTANGSFGDLAKNVQYLDDGYARLVRLTDLRENLTNANGIFIDEPTFNYLAKSKLKSGDILVANVGAYSGLFCEMPKVEYPCSLAPNMFLIRTNKRMIQHFLFYVGSSNFVWEQLVQKAVSSAQPKLNKTDIKTTFLPIPPIDEQQRIADFLDEKCGEIDSIRSDIQKQIDILNDYKKSVITEAVTKGLNPKAKLKDSGIEWIGKIPEGWDVKRFKYIADALYKGNGITKEQVFLDGNTQCVRYGEIYSKYNISFSDCLSLTKCELISSPQYFEYGDILFAGTGELVEEIGKNIVYLGNEKCLAGGDIVVARHSQNPSFLNYALGSSYCQSQKSSGKAKLKVVHISATQIGNILVAVPPLPEQKAIADYLDEKCSAIDATIADKQKQLETLDEYKKSLIFEYVTGKKEVV